MGWASDALFRDLGINPNRRYVARKMPRRTEEERTMSNIRSVPDPVDLVKVCDNRHIIGQTDKALLVRVGQTLYGEPITSFYPKSMCHIRTKPGGGYELFVPRWCNRNRTCRVGDFEVCIAPGFEPLPF